jgi:hypothetical protein
MEIKPSTLEPVRALVDVMTGFRRLFVSLAGRLEGETPVADPHSDAPEEGAALLASELRCLVEDAISPAIHRLEMLIEEWTPHLDQKL